MKSILKEKNLDQNLEKINNLVVECNDIVKTTYQFIRLYILDRFEKNLHLPRLNDTEIFNFMKCLSVLSKGSISKMKEETKKKVAEYDEFYQNTFKLLINKPKFNLKGKTQILLYLAKKMETCYNNNIAVHFIKRIRKFMYITNPFPVHHKDTKEIKSTKKSVFDKVINSILLDKIQEVPENYKNWALNIKNKYLPGDYSKGKGIAYNLKSETYKYLEYTIKINKAIEDINKIVKNDDNLTIEDKRKATKKLFQPVSLRTSNVPHYITIDAQILLKQFGLKGDSKKLHEKGAVKKYNNYFWSLVFDIDKQPLKPSKSLLENGYKVSTIETDGVAVSIIFQKKAIGCLKVENSNLTEPKYIDDATNEEKEEINKRKIVSVDPGKGNMVYLYDGEKKLRYTNAQRRCETKSIYDSKKILRKRKESNLLDLETELSKFNSKTTDLNSFKEYLAKKVFQPLREWVGGPIKINSFYRSEELNSRINGASKTSAHLVGQAIDITTMGKKTNKEMFDYIIENLDFDQVISEYPIKGEPQWIHVSYVSKKDNRKQALEIRRKGRYYTYTGCKNC